MRNRTGSADDQDARRSEAIRRTLRAVREHLGLDVAFVSEFVDDRRIFRYVDSSGDGSAVEVGGSDPLDQSYCHYVATNQLPQFLPDPAEDPVAAAMPVTNELPVGTHFSVPIRFEDGRVYGTFCCFAHDVHPELDRVDLRAVQMMAALVAEYLEELDRKNTQQRRRHDAIRRILSDPEGLTVVFQPLLDLNSSEVVAVEALARFTGREEGPAGVFAEAFEVGLGVDLELKAVDAALSRFPDIPAPIRLNVNVSPDTLVTPEFSEMVTSVAPERLVVEVTEHAAIHDHAALQAAGDKLTARGIRMSIDDVGAGFSGLSRILETGADELKMDRCIVRDVHLDPVRQAMIAAFVGFCERAGFDLVAEGIESEAELKALRSLGVVLGQGYYFARPAPLHTLFGPQRHQQVPRRLGRREPASKTFSRSASSTS